MELKGCTTPLVEYIEETIVPGSLKWAQLCNNEGNVALGKGEIVKTW